MFNLVLKDLLIQKKALIFTLIYGAIFTIVFRNVSTNIYTLVIVYTLLMSACAYDDKNKSDIMLNSLPIRRRHIVLAKYLSAVIYLIIGIGVPAIVTIILRLRGISINMELFSSKGLIISAVSAMGLACIYLPINFKFGYLKSRYIGMLFFILAFCSLSSIVRNFAHNGMPKFLVDFNNQVAWIQNSVILSSVLIILMISILYSIKIYENKDL